MELAQGFPAAPSYLIHMYLMVRESEPISNGRIARKLGVSAAAVTQSLRRMGGLGLLIHHGTGTYELTQDGWRMAERIIRRHYLLERLLVDTLGAPWDLADEEANHLQITLSSRLEQILDERLGHPETCPHGNPFPGAPSEARLLSAPSILDSHEGESVRLIRVTEEGEMLPGLLSFCVAHGLRLGTTLSVIDKGDCHVAVAVDGCRQKTLIPIEYAPFLRVE